MENKNIEQEFDGGKKQNYQIVSFSGYFVQNVHLEKHGVHEVLVFLPRVQHRLRGQRRAARDIPQHALHRQILNIR